MVDDISRALRRTRRAFCKTPLLSPHRTSCFCWVLSNSMHTYNIYIRARQIAIASRLARFLGAISNERVEDGIVNCSAVAFAEQVVLALHNRWTLGTFLIIHAIAVGLYGSVEVTQLCPRNRSGPGAVHIEEVESMALRPVVQELPGVALAAFARGKRPCSSRL